MHTLLHLSDLHFGYEENDTAKSIRNNCMRQLISKLKHISQQLKIKVVIISGDIGWSAKANDYTEAKIWITEMINAIEISPDKLIICPGNHDVNRDLLKHCAFPERQEEANKLLCVEELDELERRFSGYIKFCKELKITPLELGEQNNYLLGMRDFEELKIFCLNSSWFSKDDIVADKMWIGNNFLEVMQDKNNIKNLGNINDKMTICVMHHPETSLHSDERSSYANNINTYESITKRCNLLLTGHTHEVVKDPKPIGKTGYAVTAGATYNGNTYRNNFSIYEISKHSFKKYSYEYVSNSWEDKPVKDFKFNIEEASSSYGNHKLGVKRNLIEHFRKANVNLENISEKHMNDNGFIIWPVVPRKIITHIHQAQIEVMRIMSLKYNWKTKVIISNCGYRANRLTDEQMRSFIRNIKEYLHKREVKIEGVEFLSEYFKTSNPKSKDILESFIKLSSDIKKFELEELKTKNYQNDIKSGMSSLPVLDYILPILQLAVVYEEANKWVGEYGRSKRPVVLAGTDEKKQWRYILNDIGNDVLGAILIPRLQEDRESDKYQAGISERFTSSENLLEEIEQGNLGYWLYRMFVELPSYYDHTKSVQYDDRVLLNWESDEFHIPNEIDKCELAKAVWRILGQAV